MRIQSQQIRALSARFWVGWLNCGRIIPATSLLLALLTTTHIFAQSDATGPKSDNTKSTAANPAATKSAVPSMINRESMKLTSTDATTFQTQVEYDGSIVLLPVDDKPGEQLPLNVRGKFEFTQVLNKPDQASRAYQVAEAEITINGNATRSELNADNHQLNTRIRTGNYQRPIQYNSVGGLLKQTEQELLSIPADPLSFSLLLADTPDLIGEKWVPNDLAVRAFLSVDQVVENQLQLMVKEQTSDITKVYMVGDVKAEVDGAETQIHVVAIAIIDHKSQTLASLRVNLDEQRETSQISPGFIGKAKIDLRGKPLDAAAAGTFRLASTTSSVDSAAQLLWNTDSAFELVYDPRWKIILSDSEAVIMRYTDQGNLLAQCNVLQLPKRPAERPVSIDEFEKEIRKILVESDAQIVKKDVMQTKNGCSAIRIVVQGIQDEIPIVWIYYNVANPDGRRVAMIFTAEQSVLGIMASADQHLVNAVRFPTLKNAAAPGNPSR